MSLIIVETDFLSKVKFFKLFLFKNSWYTVLYLFQVCNILTQHLFLTNMNNYVFTKSVRKTKFQVIFIRIAVKLQNIWLLKCIFHWSMIFSYLKIKHFEYSKYIIIELGLFLILVMMFLVDLRTPKGEISHKAVVL